MGSSASWHFPVVIFSGVLGPDLERARPETAQERGGMGLGGVANGRAELLFASSAHNDSLARPVLLASVTRL
jgi:hypothetical protein